MKLIDSHNQYSVVLLPGFEKITLGEILQDIDIALLEKTVKELYGDRLILVPDDVEPAPAPANAVAVEPAPAPEPLAEAIEPEPVAAPEPEPTLVKPKRKS